MRAVEPFFFLPGLLIAAWLFILLRQWLALGTGVLVVLSLLLAVVMMSALCVARIWVQPKGGEPPIWKTS